MLSLFHLLCDLLSHHCYWGGGGGGGWSGGWSGGGSGGGGRELVVERWRGGGGGGGGRGRNKTPVFEPLFPASKAE